MIRFTLNRVMFEKGRMKVPELQEKSGVNTELESKLNPQNSSKRPLPDYDYIHKELMRKGVT
jgi:hypothetical protein